MAPFDFAEELLEDEGISSDAEDANPYLKDPDKGLALIRLLLEKASPSQSSAPSVTIPEDVFPLLSWLNLKHEAEIYQQLVKINARLKEQHALEFLDGKVVLGVGGRFSAGKSCFINSITNAELPENQRETTSIATYVVQGSQKENIAHTIGGGQIVLEDEAVQALTHQFYDTYHIGFSRVIRELVITSPSFRYPNIAILDTPGYNKADSGKMKEATDAENARQQLQAVDYLIWLVDIENGELKADDEKFIDTLKLTNPGLIVFNKAGIVTQQKAKAIVESTAARLSANGKTNYSVIAYDSMRGETIVGAGTLESFLNMVNENSRACRSVRDQLQQIREEVNDGANRQIQAVSRRIVKAEEFIENASGLDMGSLRALIGEYILSQSRREGLADGKCRIMSALSQD